MSDDTTDLGFVPVAPQGEGAPERTVFQQLLEGTEDDERAVEPTDDELGTLEEEWQHVVRAREAHQRAQEHEKAAKKALTAAKERMAQAMEREGTRQFRGSDGGMASATETYTTTVTNEEEFMGWVKESHPELLSVHSQTRTSFIRNQYRDRGVPVDDPSFPPGLEAGVLKGIQVRGARAPEQNSKE